MTLHCFNWADEKGRAKARDRDFLPPPAGSSGSSGLNGRSGLLCFSPGVVHGQKVPSGNKTDVGAVEEEEEEKKRESRANWSHLRMASEMAFPL